MLRRATRDMGRWAIRNLTGTLVTVVVGVLLGPGAGWHPAVVGCVAVPAGLAASLLIEWRGVGRPRPPGE